MIDHINNKLKDKKIVLLHQQRTMLVVRDVNPPVQQISWSVRVYLWHEITGRLKISTRERCNLLRSHFTDNF